MEEKKVVHSTGCKRVFSRYDAACPRCLELMNGANPRKGWGDAKRHAEEVFIKALKAHNCKARNCGPVCTFGDW